MTVGEAHEAVETYFALMREYYARGGGMLSFGKGYWWTEGDAQMQSFERKFRALGTDWLALSALWDAAHSAGHRASILHLMGWSAHLEQVAPILAQSLADVSTEVSNAAARALFPMVASGKHKLEMRAVIALLHRPSSELKNKALGLLAYWPHDEELEALPEREMRYIHRLSRHDAPMYAPVAKWVTERLAKFDPTWN